MTTPVKTKNQFVESVTKGFKDIQMVLQEGNYNLFVKQAIVIVVLFLGFRYVNGCLNARTNNYKGQMAAIEAQASNEQDYLSSKAVLQDLEPRFPDMADKNDWLLRQIVSVFRDSPLTPQVGAQTEDANNPAFLAATTQVTMEGLFMDFGRLLAEIENRPEYLRISDITVEKSKENLGQSTIEIRLGTIFPKEKVGASLFKDAKGGRK